MEKKEIIDAYCKIRTIDQTISDDVLDFMKDAAIEKLSQLPAPSVSGEENKTNLLNNGKTLEVPNVTVFPPKLNVPTEEMTEAPVMSGEGIDFGNPMEGKEYELLKECLRKNSSTKRSIDHPTLTGTVDKEKKKARFHTSKVLRDFFGDETPEIITMCGSTRFADLMASISWEYEKLGKIVLRVNYLPEWYVAGQGWTESSHGAEQSGLKEALDELHKRKIDISDKIFVCNQNGYIGESTRNEINYAIKIGKPIYYLEGHLENHFGKDDEIKNVAESLSIMFESLPSLLPCSKTSDNEKLSKEKSFNEIIKDGQNAMLSVYEQKILEDKDFWPKREKELIEVIKELRKEICSLSIPEGENKQGDAEKAVTVDMNELQKDFVSCKVLINWLLALKKEKDKYGKSSIYLDGQPKAWKSATELMEKLNNK